jgi:hypothetical protein
LPASTLLVAARLAVGGCGSNNSSTAGCSSNRPVAGKASLASGSPDPVVAAGWTLPGGNLQITRDVASPINNSNVSKLAIAWGVPIEATASFGTPSVMAILATGCAPVGLGERRSPGSPRALSRSGRSDRADQLGVNRPDQGKKTYVMAQAVILAMLFR